jgi:hypothetical protein
MWAVFFAVDLGSADDGLHRRRGDFFELQPEGYTFGTDQLLAPADGGRFVRIRVLKEDGTPMWVAPAGWVQGFDPPPIQTMPVKLQAVYEQLTAPEPDQFIMRPGGKAMMDRFRHAIQVMWDELPSNVKSKLNNQGTADVKWSALRDRLRKKATDTRLSTTDLE